MTPLERKIRLSSGKSSLMRPGRGRNRSPSVLGGRVGADETQQLVSDENADDHDREYRYPSQTSDHPSGHAREMRVSR
jgi:hypothetical protein